MLLAYDYIEDVSGRSVIQSPEQSNQELKLAKDALRRVIQFEAHGDCLCPGCRGKRLESFFTKWEVEYLRCLDCGSVFTTVDWDTLENYRHDSSLCAFRASAFYQQEALDKRSLSWREILDWISFRSFRYLGKNRDLTVVSGGDQYSGFIDLVKSNDLCGRYQFIDDSQNNPLADIGLSLNLVQQTNNPREHFATMNAALKPDALLFLSLRVGTGFDILILKQHARVFPYEHVSLLSRKGAEMALADSGFELLDYSTPGSMDVGYVRSKSAFIPQENLFIKSLIENSDTVVLSEFQRFLQKSGLSSYAHIVACKVAEA